MSRRRNESAIQAVRPIVVADVGQDEEEEEMRGEEPAEVDLDENQRRGERKEGGKDEPSRVEPDAEIGGRMRNIGDPRLPTRREVENHNLTHVPYRNWCPHCVRGRGKDLDHRRSVEDNRRTLEFSFDYCFLGDDGAARMTVLAGRERVTGMMMASAVPAKGTSGQFAVLKVLEFLKQCGAEEAPVILKSDQEPAIEALVKDVVAARGQALTMVEKSPIGSSGSNGVVERAVQGVEGQIRTLRSACEDRLQVKFRPDDRMMIFLVEYAAHLLNRLEVGKDGKTAYERSRGKRATVMAVEFGERLLWRVRRAGKQEKMNPRWDYGVFVGIRPESGEVLVAVKEGIQVVRSVRRLPVEERWGPANKDMVRHVPWNRSGSDPLADGEIPEEVAPKEHGQGDVGGGAVGGPKVVVVNMREQAPKEFYIRRKDVEEHGITKGCAGCRTMFHGGTRQNHTAECRERFRQILQHDARVQRMADKRKEYEEKAAEDAQKKQEKKKRREERKAGKKRAAEDGDLDAERLEREAPAEGEERTGRPAPDHVDRERRQAGQRPGSSGDGGDRGNGGGMNSGTNSDPGNSGDMGIGMDSGMGSGMGDGADGGMDVEAVISQDSKHSKKTIHGGAVYDRPDKIKAQPNPLIRTVPNKKNSATIVESSGIGKTKNELIDTLGTTVEPDKFGYIEAVRQGDAFWDDVRGGWLDRQKVLEARMEEVGFMEREHLWDVVPRSRAEGHRIISVRWVDTNKGSLEAPEIRCRLVARDFKSGADHDGEDLFAVTPPVGA